MDNAAKVWDVLNEVKDACDDYACALSDDRAGGKEVEQARGKYKSELVKAIHLLTDELSRL